MSECCRMSCHRTPVHSCRSTMSPLMLRVLMNNRAASKLTCMVCGQMPSGGYAHETSETSVLQGTLWERRCPCSLPQNFTAGILSWPSAWLAYMPLPHPVWAMQPLPRPSIRSSVSRPGTQFLSYPADDGRTAEQLLSLHHGTDASCTQDELRVLVQAESWIEVWPQ